MSKTSNDKAGGEVDALAQTAARRRSTQGFIAAITAGFFLGLNFNPSTYLAQLGLLDKAAGLAPALWRHSISPADYVISHYCGIFLTTSMYFLLYWMFASERFCGKEVVLPGMASGVM